MAACKVGFRLLGSVHAIALLIRFLLYVRFAKRHARTFRLRFRRILSLPRKKRRKSAGLAARHAMLDLSLVSRSIGFARGVLGGVQRGLRCSPLTQRTVPELARMTTLSVVIVPPLSR